MEGPSLVILCEELQPFTGHQVLEGTGNAKIDLSVMDGQRVIGFRSWGKHFIVEFDTFFVRIHFLLFGSYRVNEKKEGKIPRLSLMFPGGEVNFYTCSVRIVEGKPEKIYDWRLDLMSEHWSSRLVMNRVAAMPERMICDVLMDQEIFAGLGNIIKNEVLFNAGVHPESLVKGIDRKKLREVVQEARRYSFEFYKWKKVFQLRKHWKIYKKRKCRVCGLPIAIRKTGEGQRTSYFCPADQRLYG